MTHYERELTLDEAITLATDPSHRTDPLGGTSGAGGYQGHEDSWYGGKWAEAVKRARDGWREGRYLLRRKLETMPPAIREAIRPRPVWGPSGSAVDMGRFLAGDPDSMIEVVRTKRQGLVLRIAVERAVSYGTSTDDIVAVGASVLAVVDRLRTAGVASEVWVTWSSRSRDSKDTYQLRVRVQEAGRPIDIDRLAFWVMDPLAHRRICFAIREMEPTTVRRIFGFTRAGYYGNPARTVLHPESFDECAPAPGGPVAQWVEDVLNRRAS